MGEKKIVYLENIDKRFAGVHALKKVNLGINNAEIHCLAGENGSGKSTLIKIISGVYHPDEGEVFINGKSYPSLTPYEAISSGIQVIYQDFSLFHNLSVAENIALNRQIKTRNKFFTNTQNKKIAKIALEKINIDINLNAIVGDLSVADKQLVAIARALIFDNSKLIIMDEPTTALTHQEVQRLLDIILSLKENGISTLFVSHKLRELTEVSDKITIMRNGEKVAEGKSNEFDEKKIVFHMIGREIEHHRYIPTITDTAPMLEVKNICYKDKFKDVSFSLKKGEILGITGLLGCGRTEIALSLFGSLPIESGTIHIEGQDAHISSINKARSYGIGYVPEDRLTEGLFLSQSILNNTIVSSYDKITSHMGVIDFSLARDMAREKIEGLKLNTSDLDMPVKNLSGGNQQRVVIAKWLCADIKILILNGPSVGVDIGSKFEIHQKLKEIVSQGIGVIIISDDIPELIENCNRVLLIHKGTLIKEFDNHRQTEEELIKEIDRIR